MTRQQAVGGLRGCGFCRYTGYMSAQPDKHPAPVAPEREKSPDAPLTEREERRMLREMIERRKPVYDALAK